MKAKWEKVSDAVLEFHLAVLKFDMNELVEYRRIPCRYCWGKNFMFQHSPETWAKGLADWNEHRSCMREARLPDPGPYPSTPPGGWYDQNAPINTDCPECAGMGDGKLIFKDTRYLSPEARLVYNGMKKTRDGIEAMALQRQKSLDFLADYFGVFEVGGLVARRSLQ